MDKKEELRLLRRKVEDLIRKDERILEIVISMLRGIGVKLEVKV